MIAAVTRNAYAFLVPVFIVCTLASARLDAQSETSYWEGPYTWFSEQDRWELEHAALIGRPGEHQGKVVMIRDHINRGLWLWDPAAPTSVSPANLFDNPIANMACCGHSWDADGDLVMAGGDRNGESGMVCGPEPTWSHVFDPVGLYWDRTPDMLLPVPPTAPPRPGYYYPTTIAGHEGSVWSIGGSSSPPRAQACGAGEPFSSVNFWQRFDKPTRTWRGENNQSVVPVAGLPFPAFTFGQYPRVALDSEGFLFVLLQTSAGVDPFQQRRWSVSANADVKSWPPSTWTLLSYNQRLTLAGQTINLTYPTAVTWPYELGASSPIQDRYLVINGWDDQGNLQNRTATKHVWEITNPRQPTSAWTIPAQYGTMTYERVFPTAVLSPDLSLYVFGGSQNFFSPYDPPVPMGNQVAPIPVYHPEKLDLLNPSAGWQVQPPHQSPRLYHSPSLLLRDGRILVASGYPRVAKPSATGSRRAADAVAFSRGNHGCGRASQSSPGVAFATHG